jgi:hypothetical protein
MGIAYYILPSRRDPAGISNFDPTRMRINRCTFTTKPKMQNNHKNWKNTSTCTCNRVDMALVRQLCTVNYADLRYNIFVLQCLAVVPFNSGGGSVRRGVTLSNLSTLH